MAGLFPSERAAGDWLDIGCGLGDFLASLQRVFGKELRPRGTEPNMSKIETAQRRGLDVSDTDLRRHETSRIRTGTPVMRPGR
jgi:ubiquinone/menaquinone biosynthesis C-methylase UbiE